MPRLGPRLRDSQRQVIVFLDAQERGAIRDVAYRHNLTLGEALALAINVEMGAMGMPQALTPGRQRQFRRVRGAAAPRSEACPTPARRGMSSVAAWYDRSEVRILRDRSRECGRSLQDIARSGVLVLGESDVLAAYVAAMPSPASAAAAAAADAALSLA